MDKTGKDIYIRTEIWKLTLEIKLKEYICKQKEPSPRWCVKVESAAMGSHKDSCCSTHLITYWTLHSAKLISHL